MTTDELKKLVQDIVSQAQQLSAKHTDEASAPVNYACIFTQSHAEYEEFLGLARALGKVVEDTAMGPVFKIQPLATTAGELHLLKIRRPDIMRPERGDADFTVANYPTFKNIHLGKQGFALIERKNMEMIELADPAFRVLVYYSYPTLAEVLQITN